MRGTVGEVNAGEPRGEGEMRGKVLKVRGGEIRAMEGTQGKGSVSRSREERGK